MKIDYKNYPILEVLEKGELTTLPLAAEDLPLMKIIQAKYLVNFHKNYKFFRKEVNVITKPFYEASQKSTTSIIDLYNNIIDEGEDNPFYGKKHSEETLIKLRERIPLKGKDCNFYGKMYHGKGAWYICKDGSRVWMRSSWEIKFAKYLDDGNVNWLYEPKTFPIKYNDKEGTYTPDFYKIDEDIYYEIKGWWRDDAKLKYEAFCQQYPKIQIVLLQKSDLIGLKIL